MYNDDLFNKTAQFLDCLLDDMARSFNGIDFDSFFRTNGRGFHGSTRRPEPAADATQCTAEGADELQTCDEPVKAPCADAPDCEARPHHGGRHHRPFHGPRPHGPMHGPMHAPRHCGPFHAPKVPCGQPMNFFLRADYRLEDGVVTIHVELPGFAKEDLTVEYLHGAIVVKASRAFDEGVTRENFVENNRRYGTFERRFRVGKIDQESIHATYVDGVLTITCTKKEDAAQSIPIE